MSVITSGNTGLTPASTPQVTSGVVENVTVAAANTEQSHTFPAYTKRFEVQLRGSGRLKLSYTASTSGTIYRTLFPGTFYREDEIGSSSTTIYFQSPTAGLVVELTSWV